MRDDGCSSVTLLINPVLPDAFSQEMESQVFMPAQIDSQSSPERADGSGVSILSNESSGLLSQKILDVSLSVVDLKKSSECDVVLQNLAQSSGRADGPETGVVLGSGKIRSFFDDPPSSAMSAVSTVRRDGLKDFENSKSSSLKS